MTAPPAGPSPAMPPSSAALPANADGPAPNGSANGRSHAIDNHASAPGLPGGGPTPQDDDGDDDEPFLPAAPLPLAPLAAHMHARVRRFLDAPSKDARTRAAQEQARASLRVIREAVARYGLRRPHARYKKLTVAQPVGALHLVQRRQGLFGSARALPRRAGQPAHLDGLAPATA